MDNTKIIKSPLQSKIAKGDMVKIAEVMNGLHVFKENVSAEMVAGLFDGTLSTPLCARNLMGLAFLFDNLSIRGLICRYWQTALARTGMILLRDGSRPQTNSAFSSALSRAKQASWLYMDEIVRFVSKIVITNKQAII